MASYKNNKKSVGLKGGPNEYLTHISDLFSIEGYKADSPDVNNPYNIINSGNITMEGVDFPVIGTDNLGNEKLMTPGNNYQFPGDQVFEVPMAKRGGGLLNKTMECNSCGWKWKAADGGNDASTCHKCGGSALPKAQEGFESDIEYPVLHRDTKKHPYGNPKWRNLRSFLGLKGMNKNQRERYTEDKDDIAEWNNRPIPELTSEERSHQRDLDDEERIHRKTLENILPRGIFVEEAINDLKLRQEPSYIKELDRLNRLEYPAYYERLDAEKAAKAEAEKNQKRYGGDLPKAQVGIPPPGETIIPHESTVGQVQPDFYVDSNSSYEVNSSTNKRGKNKVKNNFLEDTTVTDSDGYSTMNTRSVDNGNKKYKQVFNVYDTENNLLAKSVDKINIFGNPKNRTRVTDKGKEAGYDAKYGGSLPKAQEGYEFYKPIDKVGDYNEHTTNYPATSSVTAHHEYEANANPNEIDITNEKGQLVRKLQSPAFRNRYRENYKLVTGEYPSEEELDARLQQQSALTSDGPDYSLQYPYIENLEDTRFGGIEIKGSGLDRSPVVNPFNSEINPLSLAGNAIAQQHDRKSAYGLDGSYSAQSTPSSIIRNGYVKELSELTGVSKLDIKKMSDKEIEQLAIDNNFQMPHIAQYPWMISESMDEYGNRANFGQGNVPKSTSILTTHELGHTYNAGDSQLWNSKAFGYDENAPYDHFNNALRDYGSLDVEGSAEERTPYDNWIKDLLGDSASGWHAGQPAEISSAKAETEARMLNAGLWDAAGDTPFSSEDFDNFMNSEDFQHSPEALGHLNAMGAMDLKRFMKSRNKYQLEQDAYNSGDSKFRSEYLQRFKNKDYQKFYDEQGYTKEEVLEMYNSDKKRKNKKATQFYDEFDAEFGPEHMQGIDKKLQYRNEHIRTNEGDVRSKLDKYFNMLAQNEGQSTEPTMARYGGALPEAQLGEEYSFNPYANVSESTQSSEYTTPVIPGLTDNNPVIDLINAPREDRLSEFDELKKADWSTILANPLQAWKYISKNGFTRKNAKGKLEFTRPTQAELDGQKHNVYDGVISMFNPAAYVEAVKGLDSSLTAADEALLSGMENGSLSPGDLSEVIGNLSDAGMQALFLTIAPTGGRALLGAAKELRRPVLNTLNQEFRGSRLLGKTKSVEPVPSPPLQQLTGERQLAIKPAVEVTPPKVKGKGKKYEPGNPYQDSNVANTITEEGYWSTSNAGVYQYPSFMTGSKLERQVSAKDGTISKSILEQLVKNKNTRPSEAMAVEKLLNEFDDKRVPYDYFKQSLALSISPAEIIPTTGLQSAADVGVTALGYEIAGGSMDWGTLTNGVTPKTNLYKDKSLGLTKAKENTHDHFPGQPHSFWIRSLDVPEEPNALKVLEWQTDIDYLKDPSKGFPEQDIKTLKANSKSLPLKFVNESLLEAARQGKEYLDVPTAETVFTIEGWPKPMITENDPLILNQYDIVRKYDNSLMRFGQGSFVDIEDVVSQIKFSLSEKSLVERVNAKIKAYDKLISHIENNESIPVSLFKKLDVGYGKTQNDIYEKLKEITKERRYAEINGYNWEVNQEPFITYLKNLKSETEIKAKQDIIKFNESQTIIDEMESRPFDISLISNADDRASRLSTTKHYRNFPKLWKSEFGTDVIPITDLKGNDWMRVKIPENFYQNDISLPPLEIKTYKKGGELPEAQLGAFLRSAVKQAPKFIDDAAKYLDDAAKYVNNYFNPPKKSSADWTSVNKSILDNKILLQEYNLIEETAKANGTWMKNADGSAFQGTPELFIQSKSTNFQNAFPDGFQTVYRGMESPSSNLLNDVNISVVDGDGSKMIKGTGAFAGDIGLGERYVGANKNSPLYQLAMRNSDNSIEIPGLGSDWLNITNPYMKKKESLIRELQLNIKALENARLAKANGNTQYTDYFFYNADKRNKELANVILNYDDVVANKNYVELAKWWDNPKTRVGGTYSDEVNKILGYTERDVSTDDLAIYLQQTGLDNLRIPNIMDGGRGNVYINNQVPGNYLKSLTNNNGEFDLSRPSQFERDGGESLPQAQLGAFFKTIAKKAPKYMDDAAKWVDNFIHGTDDAIKKADAIETFKPMLNSSIENQKAWINSEEYIIRKQAATGLSREQIIKDGNKIIKKLNEVGFDVDFAGGEARSPGLYMPAGNVIKVDADSFGLEGIIDHEVKHVGSETSILQSFKNLRTRGYSKYPTLETGSKYLNKPEEQQVRFLKIMDSIEANQGIKKGEALTLENLQKYVEAARKSPGYLKSISGEGLSPNGLSEPYPDFDVHDMLGHMKKIHGPDYLKKLLPVINKAWLALPAAGVGTVLAKKQYGGSSNFTEQTRMREGSYNKGREHILDPRFKNAQDGKEITTWGDYINPMNWGVTDRDDDGTFDQAFEAARKANEEEFMWYGTRYNTNREGEENLYKGLNKVSTQRRKDLKDAIDTVVSSQGNDDNLEALLTMTAFMENTYGGDKKAYGRSYTRGPMSIDDIAFNDLTEPRGEKSTENLTGLVQNQKNTNMWLSSLGILDAQQDSSITSTDLDTILRSDNALAGVAAARAQYGRVSAPLPDRNDYTAMYNYYMDHYNRTDADHSVRFKRGYDKFILPKEKNGGERKANKHVISSKNTLVDKPVKLKKDGETESNAMYKDYVNGTYSGHEMEYKAEKNYDKLNRLHYNDAKTKGMSVSNYILTHIID